MPVTFHIMIVSCFFGLCNFGERIINIIIMRRNLKNNTGRTCCKAELLNGGLFDRKLIDRDWFDAKWTDPHYFSRDWFDRKWIQRYKYGVK